MLVLDQAAVTDLLDPEALIDALAPAMVALSQGAVSLPPRIGVQVEDHQGLLAAMPVYLPSRGLLICKLVSVYPGNAARGLHTHNASIQVFDAATGVPVALMDGGAITAERTAAGSALATRLLARESSTVMAMVGTGVQAETHLRLVSAVRPIREIRIFGRSPGKAEALAEYFAGHDVAIDVAPSVEAAVSGADIVNVCTHALAPILYPEWLSPGVHVNSVGLNPAGRELAAALVASSSVYVESRDSALKSGLAGSNDLLWPIRDGLMTADDIVGEIGDVISGTAPARRLDGEVTLYKSVGVGVQDAVAAGMVLDAARATGQGVDLSF
ncbi:MAG: ornithine cyclodeaminase [Flavobacteriales bacterium]|nr:ornithine cyclodeaminase [Flavobacteriales bacterium]